MFVVQRQRIKSKDNLKYFAKVSMHLVSTRFLKFTLILVEFNNLMIFGSTLTKK
jgi:hypothetical protein